MTAYVQREAVQQVALALRSLPVVVITGLRQAGKSTMLEKDPQFAGFRRVTLDDFAQAEAARTNPDEFVAGDEPLIIDEAQRCPELLIAVKRAVDRKRRNGRFILSGSASFSLLQHVSESLAGRAAHYVLSPMTRREIRGEIGAPPFLRTFFEQPRLPKDGPAPVGEDELLRGGLPAVALHPDVDAAIWFAGYERTYIERDVRDFARVPDLSAFRSFLRLAAARSGSLLNLSNLARDARISTHVAGNWLGVLEASYVLRRLSPRHDSRTTRLVKSPKLYVEDSGLCAHLIDASAHDLRDDSFARGALWEAYVAQNLAAIAAVHLPQCGLSFWNVQGRHEVDFVLGDRRGLVGIEIKAESRLRAESARGLEAFLRNEPRAKAGLLGYGGAESVQLAERIFAVPIATLLS